MCEINKKKCVPGKKYSREIAEGKLEKSNFFLTATDFFDFDIRKGKRV